jgi:hypothetical protein
VPAFDVVRGSRLRHPRVLSPPGCRDDRAALDDSGVRAGRLWCYCDAYVCGRPGRAAGGRVGGRPRRLGREPGSCVVRGVDFRPEASSCSVVGAIRPEQHTMTSMSDLLGTRGDREDVVAEVPAVSATSAMRARQGGGSQTSAPNRTTLARPGDCRLRQRHQTPPVNYASDARRNRAAVNVVAEVGLMVRSSGAGSDVRA